MKSMATPVAVLLIVFGGLQAIAALGTVLCVFAYGGIGAFAAYDAVANGDPDAPAAATVLVGGAVLFAVLAAFVGFVALCNIVAGYGLIVRRSWCRIPGFLGAAFNVGQCFPLGMVVAVLTIFVLADRQLAAEMEG